MKYIFLVLSFCLMVQVIPVSAATTDSQLVKYDKKIDALVKSIAKLEQQLAEVTQLRKERAAQLEGSESGSGKSEPKSSTAEKTWRTRFNPTSIPEGKFLAYYFDTTNPSKALKKATVDSVNINYAWSEGPGFTLDSKNFGGYWIGNFTLAKAQRMQLSVSQGWSETRVILDGVVIFSGTEETAKDIAVSKGTHTLEVEYTNNWHTTGFSMSLIPATEAPAALGEEYFKNLSLKDVWFAGVYESSATDRSVKLKKSGENSSPKILLLSSYDTVIWDASELKNSGIKVIVLSSQHPGTRVVNAPVGVPVFQSPKFAGIYESGAVPSAVYSVLQKNSTISFSGMYSAKELSFPGINSSY